MKPLNALIPVVTLITVLLHGGAAVAHSDASLDAQTAPNGGQMRMAGPYHFELVVAQNRRDTQDHPVVVYVTDHAGNKVSTAGATGTVTLLSGKVKSSVTLAPDGENRLKGVGKYASVPDLKAVASVTLAGKGAEQARFTPMAQPASPDGHTAHH